MPLEFVGSIPLSEGLPLPFAVGAAAALDLEAQIGGLEGFEASVQPPSLTADVALAEATLSGLQLAVSLGVTPPSIDVQLGLMNALLLDLRARLELVLSLIDLGGAGVHMWAYAGTAGAIGGAVDAALSSGVPGGAGSGELISGVLVLANSGASTDAISAVFKVEA